MIHYTAADVAHADRHIAAAEAHVARQEILITELELKGHATDGARDLLKSLQASLVEHRKHRDTIAAALDIDLPG